MQAYSSKLSGKTFFKNTTFLYLKSAFSQAVNILIIVTVVRKLPVTDFGIYNFLLGSVSILQVLTTGGILTLFQRYVPEYVSKKSYAIAKQLIHNCFAIAIPLLIVVLGVFYLFGNPIGKTFNIHNLKFYLSIFGLYAFLFLCDGMVQQVLSALLQQKYLAINYSIYTFIRGGLFYLVFWTGNLSLVSLLIIETLSYGFLFVFNIFLLYKKFWHKYLDRRRALGKQGSRRLLRYAFFSSFNEFGSTVLNIQTDYYVISFFLGPVQLGFYALANKIAQILESALPLRKGYEVLRSIFFSELQDSDDAKINNAFNFLFKLSLFFVMPIFIIAAVLGRQIIFYVFSAEYISAYPVLIILLAYVVGHSVFFILNLIVQLKEHVEILLYSKIAALYNIAASVIVVSFWGIKGVALASLSALIFQNLYIYFHIKKHTSLKIDFVPLIKIAVNTSLVGIVVFMLKQYIHGLISLVIIALTGGVVFCVISFFNKAFQQKERDMINNVIKMPLWSF